MVLTVGSFILLFSIALAVSFLAAMVGIGGGVLFVPLLVSFFGLSVPEARTISLFCMVFVTISATAGYKNYIIIDGTWQQAQKIYNRSPYLKALPAVKIPVNKPSAYHLRRNQRAGCLCTAECAIEILKVSGFSMLANDLQSMFLKRMAEQHKI